MCVRDRACTRLLINSKSKRLQIVCVYLRAGCLRVCERFVYVCVITSFSRAARKNDCNCKCSPLYGRLPPPQGTRAHTICKTSCFEMWGGQPSVERAAVCVILKVSISKTEVLQIVCARACMCVCIGFADCVCACVHVCLHICVCVCMCVCMCVCT